MLDLSQLSKYKENNRLEAKKAQGGLPHSIWETYSAFANTFGGYILLGVVENADKSFSSVQLASPEKLVSDFWNSVNNHSIVNVNIFSERKVQIVESGGNQIVVIEVPRADRHDKPVYTGVDPFSGTYRRNGEGDYRCTKDEVRAMMRDQADISQDARVMDTMTIDCLDTDTIRRYRQRMDNLRPGHVWSELLWRIFCTASVLWHETQMASCAPLLPDCLCSAMNTKLYASSHIIFWIIKSMTVRLQKMNGGQIV
ncbi:helix-turn-helix domain-containing protein [Gemmiger sp.]|uniref:AlbA family DNA-binding domain-containing protein n=1 Tax=Gemmiger sp. TaxID=2049027 RepID=UPI003A95D018